MIPTIPTEDDLKELDAFIWAETMKVYDQMVYNLFVYGECYIGATGPTGPISGWGDEAKTFHHVLWTGTHTYPQYQYDTDDERMTAAVESHEWFERNYG